MQEERFSILRSAWKHKRSSMKPILHTYQDDACVVSFYGPGAPAVYDGQLAIFLWKRV